MPKSARLLLRFVALGVFAASVVYELQARLAGQELPGFRIVSFFFLLGVIGVWQLTATPQEMEEEGTPVLEIRSRTNMAFWYAAAILALGYALYGVIVGSRDQAALGLGVLLLGLFAGTVSAFFLKRSRRRSREDSSRRPHA